MTRDDILKALPTLPASDRVHIAVAIKALGSGEVTAPSLMPVKDDDVFPMHVIDKIVDVMRSKGLEFRGYGNLRASHHYPAFKSKVLALRAAYLPELQQIERLAVIRLGVEYLIADLQGLGLGASASMIMRHIHRLPGVIDQAFPGYAELGLLGRIVNQSVKEAT